MICNLFYKIKSKFYGIQFLRVREENIKPFISVWAIAEEEDTSSKIFDSIQG
jgi:hypothetical protein